MKTYETMPEDLPQPIDDGACDHLIGMKLPDIDLPATDGSVVNLSEQKRKTVVYCYPMTGKPGIPLAEGWDEIPGARGCTPQSCSFRDHHSELSALGADVFGLSAQNTEYQREMVERLHLPFLVLSDANFKFCELMRLPTFEVSGMRLLKRVTMIAENNTVMKVHYPIFPSDSDAPWVIEQLSHVV
ncbi:MAG: peroxiredoxin [Tateyamaria sp.]|nr:peroxiredoxin [Tateyamaria sp.]